MTAPSLLVVEDDLGLRDVLTRALRSEGFDVVTATDGASAIGAAIATRPDALILDIGLPDSDGRDVCVALRARGVDAPVIFLTARGGLTDRLSGFAAGGDDYLVKPFAIPELVARLRSVLRRSADRTVVVGDLRLDPTTHTVRCGESDIALTPTEFRVLARLMFSPAGVVRRTDLVSTAWPAGAVVAENTLDQFVSKLRRKLNDGGTTVTISVVRGVGYRIDLGGA